MLFTANFDEFNDDSDIDDDAHRDLHRDYKKSEAEEDKYPQGRPGGMLNRLISHGNKKTEDEINSGSSSGLPMSKENQAPATTGSTTTGTTGTSGTTGS